MMNELVPELLDTDDRDLERKYREPGDSKDDTPNFQFTHNAQIIKNLKPPDWRIYSIMEDNTLYYDFGDVGNYKTFVGLDRLLCVATGKDYHGHPVRQETVFISPVKVSRVSGGESRLGTYTIKRKQQMCLFS